MNQTLDEFFHIKNSEKQWKNIYTLGGIATILALTGISLDVVIGNINGGNLSALPQTAIDRFNQFHENKFQGLYSSPWSHSLFMSVIWSVLVLLLYKEYH
jgi:hypothetical protein